MLTNKVIIFSHWNQKDKDKESKLTVLTPIETLASLNGLEKTRCVVIMLFCLGFPDGSGCHRSCRMGEGLHPGPEQAVLDCM